MTRRSSIVSLCVAASFSLMACGSGGEPSSPSDAVALAGASAANGSSGTSGAGITGTISALSGTCPALTFALERKTIKTSAATSYGGARCTDVKNAIRVEVVGATQADGSVAATTVRLLAAATPPTPTPVAVTITGTISGLAGTCPTVSFTLERKAIRTSAATTYADGTCATLKNDAKVTVVGTTQTDGSVVATSVKITPPAAPAPTPTPAAVPSISGNITAVSGTCPALTITVERKSATTSSATFFDGKGCGDLRVGTMVNIFGAAPAGGTVVVATKVAAPR